MVRRVKRVKIFAIDFGKSTALVFRGFASKAFTKMSDTSANGPDLGRNPKVAANRSLNLFSLGTKSLHVDVAEQNEIPSDIR